MPLEPNVSSRSSSDRPLLGWARVALIAWAGAVYLIYWLGHLPGAR